MADSKREEYFHDGITSYLESLGPTFKKLIEISRTSCQRSALIVQVPSAELGLLWKTGVHYLTVGEKFQPVRTQLELLSSVMTGLPQQELEALKDAVSTYNQTNMVVFAFFCSDPLWGTFFCITPVTLNVSYVNTDPDQN